MFKMGLRKMKKKKIEKVTCVFVKIKFKNFSQMLNCTYMVYFNVNFIIV